MNKMIFSFIVAALLIIFPEYLFSQSAISQLGDPNSVYVPPVNGPTPVGSYSSGGSAGTAVKSVLGSSSSSISNVVAGALVQGMLNSLFSPAPEKTPEQIEAERAEQERIAYEEEMRRQEEAARQQELHDNLINSSKELPGSGSVDFKTLDGDMENMRKDAADQFERTYNISNVKTAPKGNDFFGVPLSDVDFETVIEPQTNPVYSDVETAVDLTDKYLAEEKIANEKLAKEKLENTKLVVDIIGGAVSGQANGEPIIEKPDCQALSDKLARYRSDMIRFQDWNYKTLTELKDWEDQNNKAFWNAVSDGASAAFGVFVDYLNETRSSASAIKKILEENQDKYLRDGIYSADQIARYKQILDLRITTCNVTEIAKESMKPWDYVNLSRNLFQGTAEKLKKSDEDFMRMVNELKEQDYLSNVPWVDAASFMTGEVINKFMNDPSIVLKPNSVVKGSLKMPYVTVAQLVVDEAYNVTDMITSYKNICTLREADGKATEAVRKIQNDMSNIKMQLKGCPSYN